MSLLGLEEMEEVELLTIEEGLLDGVLQRVHSLAGRIDRRGVQAGHGLGKVRCRSSFYVTFASALLVPIVLRLTTTGTGSALAVVFRC